MKKIKIEVPEGIDTPTHKKPLTFTEWAGHMAASSATDLDLYFKRGESIDIAVRNYNEYLEDFRDMASVLTFMANYEGGEPVPFNIPAGTIDHVVYNGRCQEQGDLFTVYHAGVFITQCRGQLNGLYIEAYE